MRDKPDGFCRAWSIGAVDDEARPGSGWNTDESLAEYSIGRFYEAHMAMSGIGQSQLLSDILAEALNTYRPGSVAVLGCAGGNGFDRILPRPETRAVGIDLNPDYIQQAKLRYCPLLPRLDLMVGDIENMRFSFPPADLVFAGLVFEYIDVGRSLRNIYPILTRDGVLVVALQLPTQGMEPVTPSPYVSRGC